MIKLQSIEVPINQGLTRTISLMNLLEQKAIYNPSFVKFVFETFYTSCQSCIPGKIWKYMQEHFQYTSDDPYDEIITAPYILLETKKGDCDDFSLFAKTCLDIIGGFNTNYILFGKEKNNSWTHIACLCSRGVFGLNFIDPIILDGANSNFNIVPTQYRFFKII